VHVVRNLIRQKGRRWDQPFTPLPAYTNEDPKEFVYDEF